MKQMIVVLLAFGLCVTASEAKAGTLLDLPLKLKTSFPSYQPGPTTPRLLSPSDLPTRFGTGYADNSGSSGGSGINMDSGTRAIIAILLTLFIGFGTGQFILGDSSQGMLFLLLDAGLILATIVFWAILAATFVTGAYTPLFFLWPVLILGIIGVRVWEFVDVLFRSGIVGGGGPAKSMIITTPTVGFSETNNALRPAFKQFGFNF